MQHFTHAAFADADALSDGSMRFVRHCCIHALRRKETSVRQELAARYPRELVRAATGPASTGTPTWAAEISALDLAAFLSTGPAPSLLTRLAGIGMSIDLSGVASARIPMPTQTASPLSAWIGEGQPIRDVAPILSAVTLAPKKCGSLTVFSNELRKRSAQEAEEILANLLRADIIRVVDGTLVGNQAATAAAPAGLISGLAPLPAGADAVADIKAVVGAVVEAGGTAPVVLMNTAQAVGLASLPGALAVPVLTSVSVPVGTIIGLDSASFIASVGVPQVEVSEQAVIHEESVAPLPIVAGGVLASPSRSLWQTDCSGLRCLFDAAWVVAGNRVAFVADAVW